MSLILKNNRTIQDEQGTSFSEGFVHTIRASFDFTALRGLIVVGVWQSEQARTDGVPPIRTHKYNVTGDEYQQKFRAKRARSADNLIFDEINSIVDNWLLEMTTVDESGNETYVWSGDWRIKTGNGGGNNGNGKGNGNGNGNNGKGNGN